MDWGLARTLEDDDWDGVLTKDFRTREGAILGTPAYMSPEQATGKDVGPGVDVWALGAVLYEILAGHRAVKGPSQREMIAQILSGSRLSLPSVVPEVDSELVVIVERALRRDPAERYPDAGAMAKALEAWFEGKRAAALAADAEKAANTASGAARWRWAAMAAAGVVAGGVGWSLRGPSETGATAPTNAQMEMVQDALVLRAQQASDSRQRIRAERLAAQALTLGESPGARGILARHGLGPAPKLETTTPLPECVESELNPVAGVFLCATGGALRALDLDGSERWSVPITAGGVQVDPSLRAVVARSENADRHFYADLENGATLPVSYVSFPASAMRQGLSMHPDRFVQLLNGRHPRFWVVTVQDGERTKTVLACGKKGVEWAFEGREPGIFFLACADRSFVRHNLATGAEVEVLPPRDKDSIVWTGATDRTGRWLFLGGVEGDVELIDMKSMERVWAFDLAAHMVRQVAVSQDGTTFAALNAAGDIWVVPADEPDGRYRLPGRGRALGFDADGMLWIQQDEELVSWSTPLPAVRVAQPTATGAMGAAWSEFGLGLAAGNAVLMDSDGHIVTARTRADLVRDPADLIPPEFRSVAWDDTGLLISGVNTGLHRFTEDGIEEVSEVGGTVHPLASGHFVLTGQLDYNPYVLRPDGTHILGLSVPGWSPLTGQTTRNRKFALLLGRSDTGTYRVVDGSPPVLQSLPEIPNARSALLANDGETLYLGQKGGVFVRNATAEPGTETLLFAADRVGPLELSPDERWLVMGTMDGAITIHSTEDGALRATIDAHARRVSAMAVSPDGKRLASGSWDRVFKLWDLSVLDGEPADLIAAVDSRWAGVPTTP